MSDSVFTFSGVHTSGLGQASKHCAQHDQFFNCCMKGTFNIDVTEPFHHKAIVPARSGNFHSKGHEYAYHKMYWLVCISNEHEEAYGWIMRWEGSKQKLTRLEVLSKERLPESFREGPLNVEVLERWSDAKIKDWASKQYWFQGFGWAPRQRSGSQQEWEAIYPACTWSGRRVLDIGTHYGFHACQAAKAGATVVGVDIDVDCINIAKVINDHIEMQDVSFLYADPGTSFDIILYLSVHHQVDPLYEKLEDTLLRLKARCQDLFVELILPSSYSSFGNGMSDNNMDKIVGGTELLTYKNKVRGYRRIYHVQL